MLHKLCIVYEKYRNKGTNSISTKVYFYVAILLGIVLPLNEAICGHNFAFALAQKPSQS
jgi:hypothetical protein